MFQLFGIIIYSIGKMLGNTEKQNRVKMRFRCPYTVTVLLSVLKYIQLSSEHTGGLTREGGGIPIQDRLLGLTANPSRNKLAIHQVKVEILHSAANDPQTGNDNQIGPQMIPPAWSLFLGWRFQFLTKTEASHN